MYVYRDDTIDRVALIPQLFWIQLLTHLPMSMCYRSDKRSRTTLRIRRWTR